MSRHSEFSLPQPERAARTHSDAVVTAIREAIAADGGSISFRDYMERVLYTPGLGYYAAAGGPSLAAAGDFVTAPEVSPLYAACLAEQAREVLAELGGGDILELGPGTGRLAADMLAELERLETLPDRYLLLERSATLREQQEAWLRRQVPHLLPRCHWLAHWPDSLRGLVLANEVLDALPVEVFRKTEAGVEQRRVGFDPGAGHLMDRWEPAPSALAHAVARVEADLGFALPAGYCSEISPDLMPWFQALGDTLAAGAALFIDYGYVRREYYLPERVMGTLVCTRAHRAHDDPYDWPGLTDITAFVDFTAVAEAAIEAGLDLEGFTPQAYFLLANGLESAAAERIGSADDRERYRAAAEVKRLTLPGEMGERFSVIGFSRGIQGPLQGFLRNDLSRRL